MAASTASRWSPAARSVLPPACRRRSRTRRWAGSGSLRLKRHLEPLGQMQRLPAGGLLDLLATTEAVCDDQGLARGLSNLRKQQALADAHGDLVVIAFESECAGHPAASGIRLF